MGCETDDFSPYSVKHETRFAEMEVNYESQIKNQCFKRNERWNCLH